MQSLQSSKHSESHQVFFDLIKTKTEDRHYYLHLAKRSLQRRQFDDMHSFSALAEHEQRLIEEYFKYVENN